MKIIPSFTAKYVYSKTPEERKYNILKETYRSSQGLGAGIGAFAVTEALDKYFLLKNKNKKPAEELLRLGKKHTRWNTLIGIAVGMGGYVIAWPWFKKCEPMQTKIYEWADKQSRIAEKAEQLVIEEDKQTKMQEKASETSDK